MGKPGDILEEEKGSIPKQGRWSADEHSKYIKAVELFGKNWKKVSAYVETRTPSQVKTHARSLENAKKREKKKKKKKKEERVAYDYLAKKKAYTCRDYCFRIVHIGNTGVGKKSLLGRYVYDDFSGRTMDFMSINFVLLII